MSLIILIRDIEDYVFTRTMNKKTLKLYSGGFCLICARVSLLLDGIIYFLLYTPPQYYYYLNTNHLLNICVWKIMLFARFHEIYNIWWLCLIDSLEDWGCRV